MPSITDIVLNDGENNVTFKPDSKDGQHTVFTSRDTENFSMRSPLKVTVRTVGQDNGKRVVVGISRRVIRASETDGDVLVGTIPMEINIRRPGSVTDAEFAKAVSLLVSGITTGALSEAIVNAEAFY